MRNHSTTTSPPAHVTRKPGCVWLPPRHRSLRPHPNPLRITPAPYLLSNFALGNHHNSNNKPLSHHGDRTQPSSSHVKHHKFSKESRGTACIRQLQALSTLRTSWTLISCLLLWTYTQARALCAREFRNSARSEHQIADENSRLQDATLAALIVLPRAQA